LPFAEHERIYIVDDDASVRDSARALLESYDLTVEDYPSAQAFLEDFDMASMGGCLLLDVNMPEMDGIELLELLRGRRIAIPVILVSAQNDPEVKARAQRAGAFAFLEKPVDDRLIDTIGQALGAS
jgi:FixJ family two-component response regulator